MYSKQIIWKNAKSSRLQCGGYIRDGSAGTVTSSTIITRHGVENDAVGSIWQMERAIL